MRRHVTPVLVLFAIVASSSFGAEIQSKLMNLRYMPTVEFSRVELAFEGEPEILTTRHEQELRVAIPKSKSLITRENSIHGFQSGLVQRIRIEAGKSDTTLVLIALRENSRFTMSRRESSRTVFLDVYPDSATHLIAKNMTNVTVTDTSALSNDSEAVGSDSTALVVGEDELARALSGDSAALAIGLDSLITTEPSIVNDETSHDPLPLSWILAMVVGVSLFGTAVLYFAIYRKSRKSSGVAGGNVSRLENTPKSTIAQLASSIESIENSVDEKKTSDQVEEELEDPAFKLAKTFHRGQEEVLLSIKMDQSEKPSQWTKKMQLFSASQSPTTDHASIAKKLGVGKGEIELEAGLRRLKNSQSKKEGAE